MESFLQELGELQEVHEMQEAHLLRLRKASQRACKFACVCWFFSALIWSYDALYRPQYFTSSIGGTMLVVLWAALSWGLVALYATKVWQGRKSV
jgi:hypothetical protein